MESAGRALERYVGGQGDSMGCVGRASHVQTVTGALVAHTLLSSATVSKHVCQAQTSGYENWDCVPTDHLCVVLHNYNYHTQTRNNGIGRIFRRKQWKLKPNGIRLTREDIWPIL